MSFLAPLEPVDYLVIGHVTEDLTPTGSRLGGTATFSALTARALGLRVGVVTAVSEGTSLQALDGISIVRIPSPHTTMFENIYLDGVRKQIVHHPAARISFKDVWRNASIIHLGPVAQELDLQLPKQLSSSMIGITPQGWMRTW
ncbi:MAG: carbohydrate kinase, partial [Chloroflexi bacterium]|nr:carbohydrate kinase [Chloroflexota bacterium]